jgi:hypothetical protein
MKLAIALVLILMASVADAGTLTATQTTTGAQDTYVQTVLVPLANTAKCARFGLAANCTSANLVSAGCVAVAFSTIARDSLIYRDCTIFTQDSAGANALASEVLALRLVDIVTQELANDIDDSCVKFKALSLAQRNQVCTDLGKANLCRICR